MTIPTGDLELIDLDIPQLGYYQFISSWLYTGPEGSFLVDPGPACTIPLLNQELTKRNVNQLDWILLTHIHQDHAGGLGDLINEYPDALVVVHEKGARHIIDPGKLWEGSKKILGDVAEVYGRILPVPPENVVVLDDVPFGDGIKIIPTPGHASHHQCFVFKNWLFAGELFGAHIPMKSGLYLRSATPHRFILEDYLSSMELVKPFLQENICFAHYGMYKNSQEVLDTARNQLQLWLDVIRDNRKASLDNIFTALLNKDPVFGLFDNLDPQMQVREKHFSINSIQGIIKYIELKNI